MSEEIYSFPEEIEKPKYLIPSYGIVKYDPKLGRNFDPWWIILQVEEDFQKLYRWFFKKTGKPLYPPAWGTHVSLNRGVEPDKKELWGSREGQRIDFLYDPEFATNGKHWWVHVYSKHFLEIRNELGLSEEAYSGWTRFHLTIGKESE